MASISWLLASGEEETIIFDATVREKHGASATLTTHPVEGSTIADGVQPDQDAVALSVVLSSKPIKLPTDHMDGNGGRPSSLSLVGGDGQEAGKAVVLQFDGPVTRPRVIYEKLLELMNAGTLMRVTTSLREYESMALEVVDVDRDASTSLSIFADLHFSQERIVSSTVVDAPEPREVRAARPANSGRQGTSEPDPPTAGRSLLAAGVDGLASMFGGG